MLNISKEQDLKFTLESLHKRFGVDSIHTMSAKLPVGYQSTGFQELDAVFDGFPIGQVTHLMGDPTAGMTTLVLIALAHAQAEDKFVSYIDPGGTFDPSYATRCGIRVDDLLLVRPPQYGDAFDMLYDITTSGLLGLVIFDTASELLPANQRRLLAAVTNRLHLALDKAECALVLLTFPYPQDDTLPTITSLRLKIEMERWIFRGRDVRGYQVRATLLKHRSGSANRQITFSIDFDNKIDGDGTA